MNVIQLPKREESAWWYDRLTQAIGEFRRTVKIERKRTLAKIAEAVKAIGHVIDHHLHGLKFNPDMEIDADPRSSRDDTEGYLDSLIKMEMTHSLMAFVGVSMNLNALNQPGMIGPQKEKAIKQVCQALDDILEPIMRQCAMLAALDVKHGRDVPGQEN